MIAPGLGLQMGTPVPSALAFAKAYSSESAELGANERLRLAPALDVVIPVQEISASGAPSVRRVARPACIAVDRQQPLLVLELVHGTTSLRQPAKNRPIRSSLHQSRTVGLVIDLQHSFAPNCKSILSMARKFERTRT